MKCSFLVCIGVALRLVKLDVPSIADPRWEKVSLKCEYNLEGEALYSVKWYKDGLEFFRFMPEAQPPGQNYPVDGVFVDISQSDSTQVTLLGQASTQIGATSIYKRELQSVTTAAPPLVIKPDLSCRFECFYRGKF